MPLERGARLGPYEIIGVVGRGGMGEVYRARDTRLGRDVAIKVVSPALAGDAQALARFEREARAVAALSHPNIVAVYDIGHEGAIAYVVTELLEGETLRERLKKGPLPARKAIETTRGVADALGAAHARGIVHRDLKPDNVFVTSDGRVKVLDFGIAQISAPIAAGAGDDTGAPASTGAGAMIGTIGYMAPEQVRGAPTDARTDVFALGALLYELLTGSAAFARETPADSVTAVLSADPPDLPRVTTNAGPAVEQIVRRCLEKDAGERFQSARDLSFALEAVASRDTAERPAAAGAAPGRSNAWTIVAAVAVGLLGIVVAAAALFYAGRRGSAAETAPSALFSIAANTAFLDAASVSPDGQFVAYTGGILNAGQTWGISVRRLDSEDSQQMAESDSAVPPFYWSPDGRQFGYFLNFTLTVRDIHQLNGAPRTLATFPSRATGAAWGTKDIILVSTSEGIYRVSKAGGAPQNVMRTIPAQEVWRGMPSFLPGGDRFVYSVLRGNGSETQLEVRAATIEGKDLGLLTTDAVGAMYAAGCLFFGRNGALLAQPFDAAHLRFTGEPVEVATDVSQNWRTGDLAARASENGVVVFKRAPQSDSVFTWVDRTGKPLGRVGGVDSYTNFDVSRDARRIVAVRRDPKTAVNSLVLIDVARGVTTPITPADEDGFDDPTWHPDGRHIAYRFNDSLRMRVADGGEERILYNKESFPDHFTHDGRFLTFGTDHGALYEAWALDILTPGAKPILLVGNVTLSDETRFSKNEKWVAYHSNQSGSNQVWVIPFPPTGEAWQISQAGGVQPRWSADGNELFFLDPDGRMMAVSIPEGDPRRAAEPRALFLTGMIPSNALDQFAVVGDRFLLRLPATPRAAITSPIQVLVNWKPR